jgi:hypothetical protein
MVGGDGRLVALLPLFIRVMPVQKQIGYTKCRGISEKSSDAVHRSSINGGNPQKTASNVSRGHGRTRRDRCQSVRQSPVIWRPPGGHPDALTFGADHLFDSAR